MLYINKTTRQAIEPHIAKLMEVIEQLTNNDGETIEAISYAISAILDTDDTRTAIAGLGILEVCKTQLNTRLTHNLKQMQYDNE